MTTTTRPTRSTTLSRRLTAVSTPTPRATPAAPQPWLRVRDLQHEEGEVVAAVFDGLSDRSRYLRFNTGHPRLAPAMLRQLSQVVPDHHLVHVAEQGGEPVGLVRWIRMRDEPQRAEVALEVVDSAQRQGIGRLLFSTAVRSARAAGIAVFVAYVSGENASLRRRLLDLGARRDPVHPDELHLSLAGWGSTAVLPAPRTSHRDPLSPGAER